MTTSGENEGIGPQPLSGPAIDKLRKSSPESPEESATWMACETIARLIRERNEALAENDRLHEEDFSVWEAIGEEFTLDPPDGGSVTTSEAATRIRKALDEARAALARARDDAFEDAAQVLDWTAALADAEAARMYADADIRHFRERAERRRDIAAEIRALKGTHRPTPAAIIDEWMHTPTLRQRAGEMTAETQRTVLAVLAAIKREVER
jgi:hypothetical protein